MTSGRKNRCQDIDESQVLLSKESLANASNNVLPSLQLDEGKNKDTNSTETQHKEEQTLNKRDGQKQEKAKTQELKQQDSNGDIELAENIHSNENEHLLKDTQTVHDRRKWKTRIICKS